MKILIIEDNPEYALTTAEYLSGERYMCEIACTFYQAIAKINMFQYDCILIDLMLQGGNGEMILEELKSGHRDTGIIVISTNNVMNDKINALITGADDYLSRPVHLPELAARIYAVIRRKKFNGSNIIDLQGISVDLQARTVVVNHKNIQLTRKEFDLLLFFISNQNKVISKNSLAERLSGDIAGMFDTYDIVYAHIKNLKKKLSEAGANIPLRTIYGTGYKWEILNTITGH